MFQGNACLLMETKRLQDLGILIFKVINGILPEHLRDLFVLRNNVKNLCLFERPFKENKNGVFFF